MKRLPRVLLVVSVLILLASGARSVPRLFEKVNTPEAVPVPSTRVRTSDVTFTVTAEGALQGGNSRMLTAPMAGGGTLTLTDLRKSGDLVKKNDVVAQFDPTDENFKLREAEADLAEAEQQVIQAQAEALAKEEEVEYELIKARGEVRQAEIEVRVNSIRPALTAKQNNISLEGAQTRLAKLERDYPQRKAAARASVAIQEASRKKAQVLADTARRNIDMMTLRAPADGYVNVERNSNTNFFFSGMILPLFQVGDQVRPGMAVAQIPDLNSWEASAKIAETDRGHLSVGQPAEIQVIALPGKKFGAKVKDLGGTTGPPWERRFECKLALLDASPELRPGMSTRIVITVGTIAKATWLPAQALFEQSGRAFVYARQDGRFLAKDVKLVRRGESQVVISGLQVGEEVALASPDQKEEKSGDRQTGAGVPKK
ncbi:MAG: HlyD family efflux transporter periplasmic adaptor subunit [Bryobacterales bacterium]|nr:HlyD family efflux transporter periplasmic adaptor subunit [Bryobacterales bacterium]